MSSNESSGGIGDIVVVRGTSVRRTQAFAGLTRRVLAYNQRIMLTEHRMDAGGVFPLHSHPHEQLAYLVSGRVRVHCNGQTIEVGADDSFVVPGGMEHQVVALEPSIALDVFTPVREDYLRR